MCVQDERNTDLNPSTLTIGILLFTWEIPLTDLQWKLCEEDGIISSPGHHILLLHVGIVFFWKAGLWEQRLASIEQLKLHSAPHKVSMQEQIWLGSCCAVLLKPAKTMGKLPSDCKKWGQAYFACIFLFSKTFLQGSNTNWRHLMSFSPGTRLVSDGLNVRRVLRVSIIIKTSFFVWISQLLWTWGCLEK